MIQCDRENGKQDVSKGFVSLSFKKLKNCMGYVRLWFGGLEKNEAYHFFLMTAYNLKWMYGELVRFQGHVPRDRKTRKVEKKENVKQTQRLDE